MDEGTVLTGSGPLHAVLLEKQDVASGLKLLPEVQGGGPRSVLWICPWRRLVSCFSRGWRREGN